jgi:LuxR family maltose regulon positive regulatory protein
MSRNLPIVDSTTFTHAKQTITLDSDDWFLWLDQITSFRFVANVGVFTARKEQRPGGWYWYAYRRSKGKLRNLYLGCSADLTYAHLLKAALQLNENPADDQTPALNTHALPMTKFSIPHSLGKLVARERLYRELERAQRLIWVCAPAGYGKTSLLASWTKADLSGPPKVWVSLDTLDNDPIRFWLAIALALDTWQAGFSRRVTPALLSSAPMPVINCAAVLVNLLLDRRLDIILDDFHLITQTETHESMIWFLRHLPPGIRVIIASRHYPDGYPLAQWHMQGHMVALTPLNLRFNGEEIAAFFGQDWHIPLSSDMVTALEEKTGGWAASLQILRLSGQQSGTPFSTLLDFLQHHHQVHDYLMDEILYQQSETVQNFLMQTSVMEQLSADSVVAVTEARSSVDTLYDLAARHFFIDAVGNGWYRCHALLREAAHKMLLRHYTPEAVRALQQRYFRWLAENECCAHKAIDYALHVKAYENAIPLIEQIAPQLFSTGEVLTLLNWLEKIPKAVILAHAELSLNAAYAQVFIGNLSEAKAWLAGIEDNEQVNRGEFLAIKMYLAMTQHDFAEAERLEREALLHHDAMSPDGQAFFAWVQAISYRQEPLTVTRTRYKRVAALYQKLNDIPMMLEAMIRNAIVEFGMGQTRNAYTSLNEVLKISQDCYGGIFPIANFAHQYLAMLYLSWNRLDDALMAARRALAMPYEDLMPDYAVSKYLVLARVHAARHEYAQANEVLEQIETRFTSPRSMLDIQIEVKLTRARVALLEGHVTTALDWASAVMADREAGLPTGSEGHSGVETTLVWVHLANGSLSTALAKVDALIPKLTAQEKITPLIEAYTLKAQVHWSLHQQTEALAALRSAFQYAETGQNLEYFVRDLPSLRPVLASFASSVRPHELTPHMRRVLEICDVVFDDVALAVEPLTERELSLLHHLSLGKTNQEIADDLFLGVTTVKWHLNNLYSKLGVRNRQQAVHRARELHILA